MLIENGSQYGAAMTDTTDAALKTEAALREVYKPPAKPVLEKVFPHLDRHTRRFIELSPFFCIGTSSPSGLGDVSPRGGEPGFVHALDDTHLAFPDRPGNNRLDTLTNIVHQPAVGLLFFLPGVEEMLRINGLASVTVEDALMARFVHEGKRPRSVVKIEVREVYMHCSKAIKRSELWNPEKQIDRKDFPTLGQIARDQMNLVVPSAVIDLALNEEAKRNLY